MTRSNYSDMNASIFEQVDLYISQLLAPEDDALRHCIDLMKSEGLPAIAVSANQGKLLQLLALTCGASRILELGTLGGYSTIWMARALPADGKLITLEYDPHHAAVAQKNLDYAGLASHVEIRTGKALDLLPQMIKQGEPAFDLIFIDADKPPYKAYFEYALQLSHPGTLIICDNVIREGKVLDAAPTDDRVQGVRLLNQFLADCTQVNATILQTVGGKDHDGIAIARVQ